MERTIDLKKIKLGHPFNWGQLIRLHEIGPYTIAEHYPWKVEGNGTVLVGTPDRSRREFFGWIDGKCTNTGWTSMDAALAGCIAYKHEGPNGKAATYFMRMLQQA